MAVEYRQDRQKAIWTAIAIGAAIGIAYAASRKRTNPFAVAKRVTRKMVEDGGDLAETGRSIVERVGIIYEEAQKVMEDAAELWNAGRKLLRRAA
jgi:20S proteasome alpha/beta subunit